MNTTSADLQLSNGTVSKIILIHAGQEIQDECAKKYPNGITKNEIAVTGSGKLFELSKIKHVFHGMLKTYSGAKNIKVMSMFSFYLRMCYCHLSLCSDVYCITQ